MRLGLLKDNSFSLLSAVLLLKPASPPSSGILLTHVAAPSAGAANRLVHTPEHLSPPQPAVRWPVITVEAPQGIPRCNYRGSGQDAVAAVVVQRSGDGDVETLPTSPGAVVHIALQSVTFIPESSLLLLSSPQTAPPGPAPPSSTS